MATAGLTAFAPSRTGGVTVPTVRMLTLAGLLATYQAISSSGLVFTGAMPSLWAVGSALLRQLADAGFYAHLGVTAYEAGTGILIGGSVGLLCGIALGVSRLLAAVLDP